MIIVNISINTIALRYEYFLLGFVGSITDITIISKI